MKKIPEMILIAVAACDLLQRNPQHLTSDEFSALKRSIQKSGFLVPILVRRHGDRFEIISGNHRFLAAKELGYTEIPAVVAELSENDAKKLAVNLNLIHGDPTPEQLAPFLGDLSDKILKEIHLTGPLLKGVLEFDAVLAKRLKTLASVPGLDNKSPKGNLGACKCEKCGRIHIPLA